METALNKLKKRVAEKGLKDRNKIERQIGRIQARHPQVADLYQMEVTHSAEGLRLEWTVLKTATPGNSCAKERICLEPI